YRAECCGLYELRTSRHQDSHGRECCSVDNVHSGSEYKGRELTLRVVLSPAMAINVTLVRMLLLLSDVCRRTAVCNRRCWLRTAAYGASDPQPGKEPGDTDDGNVGGDSP